MAIMTMCRPAILTFPGDMMTSFTMAQLEALSAIEQGSGVDTSQDHFDLNTSYNPPKLERGINRQIYDVLYRSADWQSRAEIAKALKLKKTGWLIAAVEQLVENGYVTKTETTRSNGMKHFWYAVTR
jgi:hypothetical protein